MLNIVDQPTRHTQIIAKRVSLAELTSESGVTSLEKEPVKKFEVGTVTLMHNNISGFPIKIGTNKLLLMKSFLVFTVADTNQQTGR